MSPDTLDVEVEAMVKELDLNQDGAVDLWEFCVQMQIMKERKTAEERAYEVLLPLCPLLSGRGGDAMVVFCRPDLRSQIGCKLD